MISVAASQSTELLPLRVRLRRVGTMDEKTDGTDRQQGRQIHLSRQEICPKNRSHPCLFPLDDPTTFLFNMLDTMGM
jgi:hypothetical protein